MRLFPRTLSAGAAPAKEISHLGALRVLRNRAMNLFRGKKSKDADPSREMHLVRRTETTVEREWVSIRNQPGYSSESDPENSQQDSPGAESRKHLAARHANPRPKR